MTETEKPIPAPLNWYPCPAPCPRCKQPTRARSTATFSRILEMACPKCGWKFPIETYRKAMKETNLAPTDEEPPDAQPQFK